LGFGQARLKPVSGVASAKNDNSILHLQHDPAAYTEAFLATEERLKAQGTPEQLARLYNDHVDYLFLSAQLDSIISVLHKACYLLRHQPISESIPIYLILANAHHGLGNMDSLLYWQQRAKKHITPNSDYYGEYLITEGLISSFDGSYTQAIAKLLEAVSVFEASGEQNNLAIAYNNLAYNYYNLSDYESQKLYLTKALSINELIGVNYDIIRGYNDLGMCYKQQNQFEEALRYYNMAFEALKKADHPMLMAQNLTNRANIFEKMEDYAQAEALFTACKKISEENQLAYGILLSHLNLGNIKRLQRQFDASATHLKQGLALSKTFKTQKEEALAYERLSWLARDRGDYKEAYTYQTAFYTLNDSLVNERVKVEAYALKEKYNAQKKENEIISLSKDKLKQQLIIVVMGLCLLVLLILLQWFILRQKLLEQKRRGESERIQHELSLKEKELLASTLQQISAKSTRETIHKDLQDLIQELPSKHAPRFSGILNALRSEQGETLLNEFETRFLGVHEDYFAKLKSIAPDITPAELRMAALMRLNFTSKEIAILTNRTVGTIDNIRSSIRKKLQLREEDNLQSRLSEL
jgi:tetratricopeptide (TPR) repeat protein/DNA-binding CsgD family transcriptional regulator